MDERLLFGTPTEPKHMEHQSFAGHYDAASVSGVRGPAPSTKSTEWTQDTTISTVQMLNLDNASDYGRTVFSITSSAADDGGSTIPIPSPSDPEAAARGEPFICNICCQPITVKNIHDDWKYHVYSDLRPYICTSDDCAQATQLYDSYTGRSEHERQFHRREWACNFCSRDFGSQESFREHINSTHAGILSEDQLHSVVRGSDWSINTPQQCPLCTKPPIASPSRFQKHLARHLQQLCLFVLSRSDGPDAGHASSESSSDSDGTPRLQKLREGLKAAQEASNGQKIFADSIRSTAEFISEHAAKLFLSLVSVKKEESIAALLAEGIDDTNLPFILKDDPSAGPYRVLLSQQGIFIVALKDWDKLSITSLMEKQYSMLCPVFRRGEHYDVSSSHILLLKEKVPGFDTQPHSEAFAELRRVYIHPDHHEIGAHTNSEDLVVTVRYFDHRYEYGSQSKRAVCSQLRTSSHPHLVEFLFSYRASIESYFVFPWADGTLADFWKTHPFPSFNHDTLAWAMEQMVGIVGGLTVLHSFKDPRSRFFRFGKDGNIGARNILWFKHSNHFGTLKIGGELMLMNFTQAIHYDEIPIPVDDRNPTYCPPDLRRRFQISDKWDIWGLGCLYLEFVTYLIFGFRGIAEFRDQRLGRVTDVGFPHSRGSHSPFFSPNYETINNPVGRLGQQTETQPTLPSYH
ncbi:hypothetical protein BJX62DRAFT_241206 [Aspergillus germanicus]